MPNRKLSSRIHYSFIRTHADTHSRKTCRVHTTPHHTTPHYTTPHNIKQETVSTPSPFTHLDRLTLTHSRKTTLHHTTVSHNPNSNNSHTMHHIHPMQEHKDKQVFKQVFEQISEPLIQALNNTHTLTHAHTLPVKDTRNTAK